MYTNPVYCTDVHKTSLLYRRGMYRGQTLQVRGMYRDIHYKLRPNQFSLQVNAKQEYSTSVHSIHRIDIQREYTRLEANQYE